MSDTLLTIKEAADYLKVHWQTIRSFIKRGQIKAVKVGRNVRIRESELQNFINKTKKSNLREIEIRFATKNRKVIESNLLKLGAKIVYHGHIIDHWFVPANIKNIDEKNKFYESAKGYSVRIREQDNGYTGKITTTLEVKKLAYPPNHEVCIEEEIDVDNCESVKNFLRLINQKEITILDKERLVYKYKDFKIVIDDIAGFKTGVEIEVVTKDSYKSLIPQMKSLAKEIGLDVKNEITDKSVTYLYMKKFAKF